MLKNWRARFNIETERLLGKGLAKLEKLPPLPAILKSLPRLRWGAIALAGLLSADLLMNTLSAYVLRPAPTSTPHARVVVDPPYVSSRATYDTIISKNAFCPGCPVPDIQALAISRPKDCGKAKPAQAGASKLIGTIVLSDPQYSVATLSDGGADSVAVKKGDNFRDLGKVYEIRRNRVCFEGGDGLLRYIEMPDEPIKFGQPLPTAMPSSPVDGISRVSDNEVDIRRSFLREKLNDPQLLFQAHAVPYKDASGAVRGFKILSIVPGSVYESLGLQEQDIITGVNGEPMTSVAKAQELYNAASTAEEVNLEIQRGGQTVTKKFRVK